ncbi:hypothetical protein ACE6H2_010967 [Prunus campanulata]
MEQPSDASRTLVGLVRARRIMGTRPDEAVQGQKIQSNTDNPTDVSSHPPALFDLDTHTFGPERLETTGIFYNSIALFEHNIPPQLERPNYWKGPMSFEQVMELRRAQITIGHLYIMDWDSPRLSTQTHRMEEYGYFLERNPLSGTLLTVIQTLTSISPQRTLNMALTIWVSNALPKRSGLRKGVSLKKRRKSPQDSATSLPTAQSQPPSRGGRTRRGGSMGKGRSSPVRIGKQMGGVIIREVSDQQTTDRPSQYDSLMEQSVERVGE